MYKTQVFTSFRGYEKRNIDWSQPMMKFNVAYGVKTDAQMLSMLDFFNARQGMAFGFRYKNWCNFKITDGPVATGDGYSTRLPLWKLYGFDGARHYKRLRKIVRGSVRGLQAFTEPLVEGHDFTIDYDSGELILKQAPGYGVPVMVQNLEFDEPVRFTDDRIQLLIDAYNSQSLTNVDLISVRGVFSAGSVFAPGDAYDSDPFYGQTRLILNFDDTNDLTTSIDQSLLSLPVTLTGSARINTDRYRHGGGALLLGATGNCSVSGTVYDLGVSPFTLEGFFMQPTDGALIQPMIAKWEAPTAKRGYALQFNFVRRRLEFVVSPDGIEKRVLFSYPWESSPNTFDHISLDRTAANWYVLRINGIVGATVKDATPIHAPLVPLTVGSYLVNEAGEGPYQAPIDSIRLTLGRNRTEGFGPGAVPAPYKVR